MRKKTIAGLFVAASITFGAGLTAPLVAAKDKSDDKMEQGSTPQELAALQSRPLPQPKTLKVVVLPFHDEDGSIAHVRIATAANYLLWQREGFQMTPILDGFKALETDKEVERGLPLRRADAVRLGKALGADLALYGEVTELRHYKKQSLFKEGKYLIAGMRISVVDTATGETIYWHQRSEKTGGTGGSRNKKADTLKRRGCVIAAMNAAKPLFAVFPTHEVKGDTPGSGEMATFINNTWPDDERDE